jgi:hypothetical protein
MQENLAISCANNEQITTFFLALALALVCGYILEVAKTNRQE